MPAAKEHVYIHSSSRLAELESSIERFLSTIVNLKASVDQAEKQIPQLRQQYLSLKREVIESKRWAKSHNIPALILRSLNEHLDEHHDNIRWARRRISTFRCRLLRDTAEIEACHVKIANVQQQLAVLQSTTTNSARLVITKPEVRQIVNSIDGFSFRNVTFKDNHFIVKFEVTHIDVSPVNRDHALRYGHEAFSSCLKPDDMDFISRPATVSVGIYENGSWGIHLTGYDGDYRFVNPHWISRHQFCMGDFAAPLSDAAIDLDLQAFLSVARVAFGFYNSEDSAGISGVRTAYDQFRDHTEDAA